MTNSRERLALIDKAIATIESGAQEYRIGTLHIVRGDLGRWYGDDVSGRHGVSCGDCRLMMAAALTGETADGRQ